MTSNELKSSPRLKFINRQQMVLRSVDVEQLIAEDHPARGIWELVGRLNLDAFYAPIRSLEDSAGRSAFDPQLLICLWIYAYSRGIGSAREIARLCEMDSAFQWLTGLEGVNHHTLSDFRVDYSVALDDLFTQVLGLLSHEGLITLERVMQDGTKIRAKAHANSFAKEERIRQHLELARRQVQEMGRPDQDPPAERRVQAHARARRERIEKLERALEQVQKLRADKMEDKKGYEPKASITDPESRIMKTSEGGYVPGYSVQITTDAQFGLIANVRVTQDMNDKHQLTAAVKDMQARWGRAPKQIIADGDFTTNLSVIQMAEQGIDFIGSWNPGPAGKKRTRPDWRGIHPEFQRDGFRYDTEQDRYVCPADNLLVFGKANKLPHGGEDRFYKARWADCGPCQYRERCCPHHTSRGRIVAHRVEPAAVTAFKAKMATSEARQIYKQRSQIVEFSFAWIKEKLGLRRFHVQGLTKVGIETLWACLTFNIQRWICLKHALKPAAALA